MNVKAMAVHRPLQNAHIEERVSHASAGILCLGTSSEAITLSPLGLSMASLWQDYGELCIYLHDIAVIFRKQNILIEIIDPNENKSGRIHTTPSAIYLVNTLGSNYIIISLKMNLDSRFYRTIYLKPDKFNILSYKGKKMINRSIFTLKGFYPLHVSGYGMGGREEDIPGRTQYQKENEAEAGNSGSMCFSHYS